MKTRLAQKTTLMGMFRHRVFLMAACLPITLAVAACNQLSAAPRAAAPTQTMIEHGKMLVIGGACHDCHTPKKLGPKGPEPDMDRMLSGHPENITVTAPYKPAPGNAWAYGVSEDLTAWSGPWGVSFPGEPHSGHPHGVAQRRLDRSALYQGAANRQAHGNGTRHPATDAVELLRAAERRGPQGDLGIPGHDSRDQESRTGSDPAGGRPHELTTLDPRSSQVMRNIDTEERIDDHHHQ